MRWVFFCFGLYANRWKTFGGSHRHLNSLPELKLKQVNAP